MSNLLEPNKKKWLSNLVLLSFLILVAATVAISNAFKTPAKSHNEFIEQALVFNNKELEKVTRLILKNKSGEYSFERIDTTPTSPWHMTGPKALSASSAFIEKLYSSLNTIKTKKLLVDDTSNNSNFSLEKPTAILTLTDEYGKSILISLGIMNTIDNSTYMKISGRSGIYHVEAPSISLENITLADLTKSTIFDFDIKTIISFKIFKKSIPKPVFEVSKKDNNWNDIENKKLNTARLEDMLNEFIILKSSFIIDDQSDDQKKLAKSLITSREYNLQVTLKDSSILNYQIGAITKSIPSLNLNAEEHFVIIENDTPIIYVIKKESASLFDLKNENLKSLEE